MNLLMATMQLGRHYSQGTERYVETLMDGLRRRGESVACLAGDPLGLEDRHTLGAIVDESRSILAYPTRGWMAVGGLGHSKMVPWLRTYRPDLVHLNTPAHIGAGLLPACQSLGIPTVVTVHDHWWLCPKATLLRADGQTCDGTPGWSTCIRCIAGGHERTWVRGLARLPTALSPIPLAVYDARALLRGMGPGDMGRWFRRRELLLSWLRTASAVIFPSRSIAELLAPHLDANRCRVIPNGLTPEWFGSPRPAPAASKPAEDLVIGYAGALAAHKAPHLLLEAARRSGWTRTRILLAGPVVEEGYWDRLVRAGEGLNVVFLGRLSRERMPAFLRGLDVLAMTSVWPENYPYAVLEAHAAGVPVVGSRVGGVPEQIADAALLFEPGSVEGLASALEHARQHPAAARPENVPTARAMIEATLEIYKEVLRPRPARTPS